MVCKTIIQLMDLAHKYRVFLLLLFAILCFLLANFYYNPSNPERKYIQYFILNSMDEETTLYLEEARTSIELQRGLMYRKYLEPKHGMIFIFPYVDRAHFWMKNTYIPLDIIMVDETGTIAEIHPNQQPHSLKSITSDIKVKYVIELNAGEAESLGIKIGDVVK